MLRYAAASLNLYTHVLKTDDDCYVRMGPLMDSLAPPWASGAKGQIRYSGVYVGAVENKAGAPAAAGKGIRCVHALDMADLWVLAWSPTDARGQSAPCFSRGM